LKHTHRSFVYDRGHTAVDKRYIEYSLHTHCINIGSILYSDNLLNAKSRQILSSLPVLFVKPSHMICLE